MCDVWDVFLAGLDPVRVEQERFPSIEKVRRESFYLPDHRDEMFEHERVKRLRMANRRAYELSTEEDFEREIARQKDRAAVERAWRERRLAQIVEFQRKVA